MNEQPKIFIAVPCMDMVASGFAQSLATLNKNGFCCMISFLCGSLIYEARNRLAAQAMMEQSDYVLWLDSDMVFDEDLLIRLYDTLQKEDADIVSGLYFRRMTPYTPVAFQDFDIVDGDAQFTDYTGPLEGTHEIDAMGFGCVLMKTRALFDVFGKFRDMFSPLAKVGEDLSFCYRAKELGLKTVLDCDIKCGHVGHMIVTESLYKAYADNGGSL